MQRKPSMLTWRGLYKDPGASLYRQNAPFGGLMSAWPERALAAWRALVLAANAKA
jgi:hypothetical protein